MEKRPNQIDRLSDVALFIRVAERGNFSLAAKDWHLSPSAVSKLVERLEGRLGVRLFDRTSRAMTLTAAGRAFFVKAQALMQAAESAQNAVTTEHGAVQGTLRVHAPPVFARRELSQVLPDFLARYPDVRIELFVGLDAPSLAERGLDVLIHSGRLPDSSMVSRQLAVVRWIVCSSPDYLRRQGTPRTQADLVRHNCLNFVVKDVWNRWQASDSDDSPERVATGMFSASDGGVLLELARRGVGIARLGDFNVREDIERGTLVPLLLLEPSDEAQVVALYQHRRHLSARIQTFVDYLVDALAPRNAAMQLWVDRLRANTPSTRRPMRDSAQRLSSRHSS